MAFFSIFRLKWSCELHIHLVLSYDSQRVSLYITLVVSDLSPINRGIVRLIETEREAKAQRERQRQRERERQRLRKRWRTYIYIFFVSYKLSFHFILTESFLCFSCSQTWNPLRMCVIFVRSRSILWMACWGMANQFIVKDMRGNLSAKAAKKSSSTKWTRISTNVSQLAWDGCVFVV